MKHIDNITIRQLSTEERNRSWDAISAQLATTPTQSPFAFPLQKAFSLAFAFVVIVGVVGISDSANPGDILFPLDTAVERIESTINPSSRANHAQERLEEFVASTQSGDVSVTMKESPASTARTTNAPAQESADMLAFSAISDSPAHDATMVSVQLPEHVEQSIHIARVELESLLSEALMRGDQETINDILITIEMFEEYATSLRASQ